MVETLMALTHVPAGGPAFEFARATTAVGDPSFAHVAKGGYRTANSEWFALEALNRGRLEPMQILPAPSARLRAGTLTVVPEPASLLLMGLGLAVLGIASVRKKSCLTLVS